MGENLIMNDPGLYAAQHCIPCVLVPCLTGPSMATTLRRSILWRSICTVLRWSKGKVSADRCTSMWTELIPSSSCLMLLNARLCARDSTSSLNWNRLLCIHLHKLIGWVCVFVCTEAHRKTEFFGRAISISGDNVSRVVLLNWYMAESGWVTEEREWQVETWREDHM